MSVPSEAHTVVATDKYLIPGLWDMHVHSATNVDWHFPVLLAHGITGVRNMHSGANDALALIANIKDRLESGELLGPRFYANGPLLDRVPAIHPGAIEIRGEVDARATVDLLRDGGADFIKVYDRLSREAYFAVMDQARLLGLPVVGHLPSRVLPVEAAEAGQSTIEHLTGMQYEEIRALMRPTIPLRLENVRLLKETGVSILAGTDLGNAFLVPGVSLHQELELMVQAGLTTLETLQAATINPARVLGTTESIGTIAPGKLADLVLLDANPLEDIRNTNRIRAVVVNGKILDRDALDSMLAAVEKNAGVNGQGT